MTGTLWGVGWGVGWGQGLPDRCFSSPELCRKYAPANFSRYYYPYRTHNSFLCVTNCTLNVPGSIDCNSGLCQLTLEGPRCL